MIFTERKIVERVKREYPEGTRVVLEEMNDRYREMPKGLKGTVIGVDDIGTIHVKWDNGSRLGVVYGEDSCRKI